MPYTINIPTATQFISQSQPLIQQNFNELQTWASVDHSPLASAAGLEGFHYRTTFVPQNPPLFPAVPTFPALYPGLYAANPVNVGAYPAQPQTGFNELFLQLNDALNRLIPVTAGVSRNPALTTRDSYFYTPSGIIVKWNILSYVGGAPGNGQFTDTAAPGNGNFTYIYSVDNSIPPFTLNAYPFLVSYSNGGPNSFIGANVGPTAPTPTSFTFQMRSITSVNVIPFFPPGGVGVVAFVSIGI